MKDTIKKLKADEKINFKLDNLSLETWHNKQTIKIYLFAIITIICFCTGYIFDGLFSLSLFIVFWLSDRSMYKKVKAKIVQKYFKIRPKK
jgi:hypothetical protein